MQETGNRDGVTMQKFDLFDETFDPFRTESYELSIQVNLNGFSFCVKDTNRNMFIALGSIPFEKNVVYTDDWLQEVSWITSQYDWLENQFRRVFINYESPEFIVVPTKYFEPTKAKQLLALSYPLHELNEIRFGNVDDDRVCIYSIPSTLANAFIGKYKNAKFVCSGYFALKNALTEGVKKGKPQVQVSFFNSFAIINFLKEGNLFHSGTIQTLSSEDTTYHLANISKQLGIKPADIDITLFGKVDYHNELLTLLTRFFGNVKSNSTIFNSHLSYILSPHKEKYSTLFNISQCE
ncbi:MAG: DUF3822 family protein [Bacteroidales bacterium]